MEYSPYLIWTNNSLWNTPLIHIKLVHEHEYGEYLDKHCYGLNNVIHVSSTM